MDPSSEPIGLGLRDSVKDSAPFLEERSDIDPLGPSVVSRARFGRAGALRCFGANGGLDAAG